MDTCAFCQKHSCRTGDLENAPQNCPCRETNEIENIKKKYQDPEIAKLAYNSALVESEGYCKKTRLEEIIDFAQRCQFHRLGIAFCIGLSKEAQIFCSILKNHGFEVFSVICKNGSVPKEFLGIQDSQKNRPGTYEPMCNPIGQAVFLNKSKTELNIMLGLCVGHDSLFIKYSDAPITVFAVKDRILAHNPLGAIYLSDSYYKNKL
ncbi:metal-binding protein [Clostridium sp. W14A]|nr:metal-binding protein [Clostridium sp. W14A]